LTQWFLAHGADPNLISKDGHTPLDFAATQTTPDIHAVIELLLSSGALLTHSSTLHNALITIPTDDACIKRMEFFLSKNVDINALSFANQPDFQTWNPSTVLHWAARKHSAKRGKKNMLVRVKWLLEHGADVKIKDSKGGKVVDGVSDKNLIKLLDS
jgi:ankyrin repeat protein